ncbi:inner membrane protein [Mycobacteroides abscessus subsp. abscessus]|uniref:metal-dependent hydrolase n=1 Tax=uncultured Rothia sp. TaxID=316088 RepID=UPI0009265046|nr:inner membrane protein [Mycobacteroides abscessus subsp. abscessus]
MMGYSHSVSAAAAWLALVETDIIPVQSPQILLVTALTCAGAGMLPDIDHKNGTIAHSIPPVSSIVSAVVSSLSGGHRKGTHSLVGLIFFWAVAILAERLTYQGIPWASLLITAYMGGLALRTFGAPGGWLGAIGLGFLAWHTDSLAMTPLAIGVGATVHVIGDFLTTRGVNPAWPLTLKAPTSSMFWKKSGYFALPLLGDAGSKREMVLTSALSLYILWFALALGGIVDYPAASWEHLLTPAK